MCRNSVSIERQVTDHSTRDHTDLHDEKAMKLYVVVCSIQSNMLNPMVNASADR